MAAGPYQTTAFVPRNYVVRWMRRLVGALAATAQSPFRKPPPALPGQKQTNDVAELDSLIASTADELLALGRHADMLAAFCEICIKDLSPYFWYWNVGEQELLISNSPSFKGSNVRKLTNWAVLVHPDDLPQLFNCISLMDAASPRRCALRVRRKGAEWHTVEWCAKILSKESNDEFGRLCGLIYAPTQRPAPDENSQLQRKQLRTAELASVAKTNFLANLSHDIRTPANAILGLSTMLNAQDNASQAMRSYVQLIQISAESIVSILNDVLDFTKIESGSAPVDLNAFSPYQLFTDTCRALSYDAARKGVEVVLSVNSSVPKIIVGDATKIKRILGNLLSNAIKFTAKGHIEVSLTATPSLSDTLNLSLVVADSGCGIPESKLSHIFKCYAQLREHVSEVSAGFGLGLPISRELCSLMGGGLTVHSQPEKGSSFVAHFSCKPSPLGDETPRTYFSLNKQNVLLAESSDVQAKNIELMLTSLGAKVTVACDVAQVREAIISTLSQERYFHWILIDSTMIEVFCTVASATLASLPGALAKIVLLETSATAGTTTSMPQYAGSILKPFQHLDLKDTLQAISEKSLATVLTSTFPDAEDQQPRSEKKGKRILLAEDNPVSRRVTGMLLQQAGYEVVAVSDGESALEYIENHRLEIDVLIADLQMPRLDGVSLTEAIRIKELHLSWIRPGNSTQLPIVGITGDATPETRSKCSDAGMNQLLTKPASPADLLGCVAEMLANDGNSTPTAVVVGELGAAVRSLVTGLPPISLSK